MRLVMMNGGLGNQVFQYIFARYIEEKTGEPCMIDDLAFHCNKDKVSHNGYEIEKIWGIKLDLLSDHFTPDVVHEMARLVFPTGDPVTLSAYEEKSTPLVDILRACDIDLTVVEEGNTYRAWKYKGTTFSVPMNQYYPEVLHYAGDLYYFGWWINGHWFSEVKDTIRREMTFPIPPDKNNRQLLKKIESTNSVSLHVRRGDFLDIGQGLPSEIYYKMVRNMSENVSKPSFFIFSDDIPWVKAHMEELGFQKGDKCTFVEGNTGENSYLDLQLMSSCKGMIVGNSSFSYLAALLNANLKYYVSCILREVPGIHF